jgi:hypothetical protein
MQGDRKPQGGLEEPRPFRGHMCLDWNYGSAIRIELTPMPWITVTPSEFPWEQEALDFLRQNLPPLGQHPCLVEFRVRR